MEVESIQTTFPLRQAIGTWFIRDGFTHAAHGTSDAVGSLIGSAFETEQGVVDDTAEHPWHEEPGLRGMELTVQQVKRAARRLASGLKIRFGSPECFVFAEDGGEELAQASVEIVLPDSGPEEVARFRAGLYEVLTDELEPDRLARLALTVRRG